MDIYVGLINGIDPKILPQLMGRDLEVTGPDYKDGWVIAGSEGDAQAALEALQSFDLVRFYVVL